MTILSLSLLLSTQVGAAQVPSRTPVLDQPGSQPNIVLIVADDFGVNMVGAYGEGADPPCTPTIDGLAAGGMLFRNAWANPACSPTRAALLTGRYGFRTGVGSPVSNQDPGLSLAEETLPTMLAGYDTTCAGKWHLAGSFGPLHPNMIGFAHYAGSLSGGLQNYSMWPKVTNGQSQVTTTYATTDTANEAIAAIGTMQSPWFVMVSFNAPHTPLHVPPAALCPPRPCPEVWCGNLPQNASATDLGKAMVEAMDAELDRVLVALDSIDPNAWVFFLGDNGTAQQLSEPPFAQNHAKGTVYEGGVNVPLIVRGPQVLPGSECQGLVGVTDLFATMAELAGVPGRSSDSVSMVPYFQDPNQSLRSTVYTESFSPNGGGPLTTHRRAVRESRYKLIRQIGSADELYDLDTDPFETANLLPNLTAQEQVAYAALVAELVALGID